jgi:DNA repair exonuclease SbcCD ATPase subunit
MILIPLLALVPLADGYKFQEGVTPIQKVIQMMQEMYSKGKQEKHDEEVRFAVYTEWCKNTMDLKQKMIADANLEMERLSADIQKGLSDAEVLGQEIAKLGADIDMYSKDLANQTSIRESEHADYQTEHADYSESIDALGRAIGILKKQSYDRKQGTAMLQKVSVLSRVPAQVKRIIESFLATDQEVLQPGLSVSAPQANAYEFQSGGVVEMLEKLKDKFADEKHELEKAEMNGKHAYEMAAEDLHSSIDAAEKESSEKAKAKAEAEQGVAADKGDLADTTSARDEDQKYLDGVMTQCQQKSKSYEERQTVRSEELEALTKAIEVIQSPSVSGHGETYLPAMVQTSLALRASGSKKPVQSNVAAFLKDAANRLDSRVLSMVAMHVQSDPFEKVKKMIKDLIVRLMEESTEEAEHKGWCDTELGTNKQTRADKAESVDLLAAKKDQLTADISKLAEDIADISDAIAAIDVAVAKATEVRSQEKEKNAKTVADAQEAQEAVASAIQILNEFYAKAAESTSFLQSKQTPEADAPETFDAPYQGQGAASGGVMGMLEVIQSDFARLEAETRSAESEGENDFESFSDESAQDKAVKQTDLEHKEKTKTEKESELNDTTKDLTATQAELDAALAYYEKLKPSCVDAGLSYEERVKQREEEIESLKEALRILEGEEIA